jgi:hypothetical protein
MTIAKRRKHDHQVVYARHQRPIISHDGNLRGYSQNTISSLIYEAFSTHDAATASGSSLLAPPPPARAAGLLTIKITESPLKNILLT